MLILFSHGWTDHIGSRPFLWGFSITLKHTSLSRTPLREWSARRRDLYQTTHNKQKSQLTTHRTHNTQHSKNTALTTHSTHNTQHSQHTALTTHNTQHSQHTTFTTHSTHNTQHSQHTALTTHSTHNRQISVPQSGFEPAIQSRQRPQTHALDRAATGIDTNCVSRLQNVAASFWLLYAVV